MQTATLQPDPRSSEHRAARAVEEPSLRAARWAFAWLIVAQVALVWSFQYFPSQDGPAHVYNAELLRTLHTPERATARDYFVVNARPDPTWLGHAVLAGLMYVVPPLAAEKVVVTLCMVLLPLATLYAVRAVRPGAEPLALVMMPFCLNHSLHMGFYAFSTSMAVFPFLLGYYIRHHRKLNVRSATVLGLLALLVYLLHPVPFTLAGLAIAILATWSWALQLIRKKRAGDLDIRGAWNLARDRVLAPGLTLLPAAILYAWFVLPREKRFLPGPDLWVRVKDLLHPIQLISFNDVELWLASGFGLLFGVLVLYGAVVRTRVRALEFTDGLLLVTAVYTAMYLALPDPLLITKGAGVGGLFIHLRLNAFPFIVLVMWLAAQRFPQRTWQAVTACAVVLTLAFTVAHSLLYARVQDQHREYLAGIEHLQDGATLLPLNVGRGGYGPDGGPLSPRIDPFRHVSNYAGAFGATVVLENYEAAKGYFPILFRPGRNAYVHIGKMTLEPPRVDFLSYEDKTGGTIDSVLVWLGRKRHQDAPETRSIYEQLEQGYDLIHVSDSGLAELYVRRGLPRSATSNPPRRAGNEPDGKKP